MLSDRLWNDEGNGKGDNGDVCDGGEKGVGSLPNQNNAEEVRGKTDGEENTGTNMGKRSKQEVLGADK